MKQSAVFCLICAVFFPVGDIGGQMGLFIGASILTVLELFDYAYEVGKLISSKLPLAVLQL